jgi:anaerobic selenocysteine-containing dehydrogenase
MARADAEARGLVEGQWAEVYNGRGRFRARVALTGAVEPGVAVSTGLYWNKLSPGGGNANQTTSSALSDMGGGATFFDNLVEIGPLAGAEPEAEAAPQHAESRSS